MRASIVCEDGSYMSINRLWDLISKCSLESLSTWGDLNTQYIFLFVGNAIGPAGMALVLLAVSIIFPHV